MPPQISDDESSVASERNTPPVKVEKKQSKTVVKTEKKKVRAESEEPVKPKPEETEDAEEDEEEDEEEDGEAGEDEYVVESITNHLVDDETGELRFEIKWEGYDKKSDRTWEPEENLATADKILQTYLEQHGGREAIIAAYKQKKQSIKKRGRASTGATPENGAKRGRKSNGTANASKTENGEFKPPTGNWEEEVAMIDACEGTDGNVIVFISWRGGGRTQHPLAQIYKRCPQKMLKFYESHLFVNPMRCHSLSSLTVSRVFKKNDEDTA